MRVGASCVGWWRCDENCFVRALVLFRCHLLAKPRDGGEKGACNASGGGAPWHPLGGLLDSLGKARERLRRAKRGSGGIFFDAQHVGDNASRPQHDKHTSGRGALQEHPQWVDDYGNAIFIACYILFFVIILGVLIGLVAHTIGLLPRDKTRNFHRQVSFRFSTEMI